MSLPLAGIRVLDLSRLLPGGFCSLLLADFGAEVLKVEDTGQGDYIRWAPPYYEGAQDSAKSAMFLSLNRNKRSIRIDLKSEGGREVLLALVREYDVVLESFRPGVLDRLGVGYERMREENPGLVYCAITGYGQTGPKRDASGHDMNYLGLIGLLGLTGEREGAPVQAAGQIADLGGGALMAAFGILAALRERDGVPCAPPQHTPHPMGMGMHRPPELGRVKASSSTRRWPTVRSPGLRWSPVNTSPTASSPSVAGRCSRARSSATARMSRRRLGDARRA